jgi:hypothetical protein
MTFHRRLASAAWGGLAALGIVLRLIRYLDNQSLWGDEAALAMNIVTRDFRTLLEPLSYSQSAPVGFLFLSRGAMLLLGDNELALRLLPCLASCLSVLLFCRLARLVLPGGSGAVALGIFAVSDPLVFYAAQLKQYSLDVALSLGLVLLTLDMLRRVTGGGLALWTLAGTLGALLSNTLVVVFAASALVLIPTHLRRGDRVTAGRLLGGAAVGGLGFAAIYLLFLRHLRSDFFVMDYWSRDFMPLPPRGLEDLAWFPGKFLSFFNDPLGLPQVWTAALVTVLGLFLLLRRSWPVAWLAVLPALFILAASGLHTYPFSASRDVTILSRVYPYYGRLLFFFAPLFYLPLAAGLGHLAAHRRPWARAAGVLLAGWILGAPLWVAARNAISPPRIHEMRPLMAAVDRERTPGDRFVVLPFSGAHFDYYSHRGRWGVPFSTVRLRTSADYIAFMKLLEGVPPGGRIWLIGAHHPTWTSREDLEELAGVLGTRAVLLRHLEEANADALLFQVPPTAAIGRS